MTLLTQRRLLALETEATAGTAETLVAADAALNVFDLTIQPDVPFSERPRQGHLGHRPQVGGARMGTVSFRTEMIGGATLPLWAELLPACGYVESTRVFTPRSEPPGANVKTVTLGVYENGLLKVLAGCMGNAVFEFVAGEVVNINWTFTGKWVAPQDATLLVPTYPADAANIPRFVNTGFSIGAWNARISRMTLDLGNTVTMIQDARATDNSGYLHAIIANRRPNGRIDPEAELVAANNTYGNWLALTEAALNIDVAIGTNFGLLFDAPKFQVIRAQEGDRQGIQIDDIEFQLNGNTGDDELVIEFDTV